MFAVSNAVYAYTAHFSVMLAFRIIPALCHPVFFSVALAYGLSPPKSGKAVTKVFSGITAGFAFGVPFTSYLADRLSLESAFLFGAIISLIAFTGILLFCHPCRSQKNVFQKPARHPSQTGFVAQYRCRHLSLCMFSVYSYFAEYLGRVSHMNGTWVSFMLMSFGVIMIAGNFVFGALLYKNMKRPSSCFRFFIQPPTCSYTGLGRLSRRSSSSSYGAPFIPAVSLSARHGLLRKQRRRPNSATACLSLFQPRHHHRNGGGRLVYFTFGNPSADVVRHHVCPSGFRADHGTLGMGKEAARRSLSSVAKSGMITYNIPD